MPNDLPSAERLTLDDIDIHHLVLEAACPACKGLREVRARSAAPGWTTPPVLFEAFAAGRMPCRIHARAASWLKVSRRINVNMGSEVIAEWRAD